MGFSGLACILWTQTQTSMRRRCRLTYRNRRYSRPLNLSLEDLAGRWSIMAAVCLSEGNGANSCDCPLGHTEIRASDETDCQCVYVCSCSCIGCFVVIQTRGVQRLVGFNYSYCWAVCVLCVSSVACLHKWRHVNVRLWPLVSAPKHVKSEPFVCVTNNCGFVR